jgi:hypothetical protein
MKNLIIPAMMAAIIGIASCNNSATNTSNSTKTDSTPTAKHVTVGQKEFYTCSMDTDVISDKPGKCPKCGMDMEKKMMADTTKVTVK